MILRLITPISSSTIFISVQSIYVGIQFRTAWNTVTTEFTYHVTEVKGSLQTVLHATVLIFSEISCIHGMSMLPFTAFVFSLVNVLPSPIDIFITICILFSSVQHFKYFICSLSLEKSGQTLPISERLVS